MPFTVTWEPNGLIWNYSGVVDGTNLLDTNLKVYGDQRFDDMEYQIVDLRSVEFFRLTEEEIAQLAAQDRAAALSNPRIKIATVAPHYVSRTVSEKYEQEMSNAPWEHRIFDTLEEARRWLED